MTINEIGLKNKLGPDFEGYDRADKEKDRLLSLFKILVCETLENYVIK